jgi:hypothetical protein
MTAPFIRLLGLSSLALLLAAVTVQTALAQAKIPPPPPANKPSSASASPEKSPTAEAPKKPVWGQTEGGTDENGARMVLRLFGTESKLVYAPGPSPMLLAGEEVFDAATRTVIGTIKGLKIDHQTKVALSPSGRYFARTNKEKYHHYIEVLDTKAGDLVHKLEFTTDDHQNVVYLTFTSHDHLLACVPAKSPGGKVCLWRMSDGKLLREMATERFDERKVAITENGAYLAAGTGSGITVYDMAKGKPVAEMSKPPAESGISSFIFVECLAFAPDGTELAAIMSGKDADKHLVVWGADGKVVEHHNLKKTASVSSDGNGLQWAQDGQGWLVHGNFFFDRRLKAIVFILIPAISHHYPHKMLNNDEVLTTKGDFTDRQLVSVKLPREAIAKAAESLSSGESALLKPGDTVNLKLEVGSTKFAQGNEVLKSLSDTVTSRLEAGGLKVGTGGNVTLTVKYSEGTGKELKVIEGGRFGFGGRDTGKTVQDTIGTLEAEMVSGGKTIFQTAVTRGSPSLIQSETVNDEEVRKAMFGMISHMLSTMQIPYFVPADDLAVRLPLIADMRKPIEP